MIYRSILLSLFSIGAGYILMTSQISLDPWSEMDAINSKTLPYIYGSGLCLCCLILGFQRPKSVPVSPHLPKLFFVCSGILVFICTLPYIGLWFSVCLLLLANMLIMGERRAFAIVATCVGVPLGGWVLVEQLLEMVIPV